MGSTADAGLERAPVKHPIRVRVVFASDCPLCKCCEEPWCKKCRSHYAECSCVGPHNAEELGYRLEEKAGVLWAIKPAPASRKSARA